MYLYLYLYLYMGMHTPRTALTSPEPPRQIMLLMAIILNRIALVLFDKAKATKLRCLVAVAVSLVCIALSCVWVPARLNIASYVAISEPWERLAGAAVLLIDGGLNLYFLRTVRRELIAAGLAKYNKLFRFNCGMIVVSLSLDVGYFLR
jgi:hypothetical protein